MSTEERQVQVLTCGRTRGGEDKIHGEVIRGAVEASLSDVHHLEKEEWVKKIRSFFSEHDVSLLTLLNYLKLS